MNDIVKCPKCGREWADNYYRQEGVYGTIEDEESLECPDCKTIIHESDIP